MSWVAVGVGLVGAVASNDASRRGARTTRRLGQQAADRVNPYLLNTGSVTQVNSGVPNAGNPNNAGPSFTFGGNNGQIAPVGNPNFNPNASINPAEDPAANGFLPFGTDQAYWLNPDRGTVFDQNGNPVNGLPVAPGSSRLDIALPDLSQFENFSLGGEIGQIQQAIGGLSGINSELSALGQQFSTDPDNPGQLLDIANQAGELLPRVAQGASEMREARLNRIDDAANRVNSDLSENFRRRRVLGSSFAGDALARAELEAGRLRGEAEAQSSLEEVAATAKILGFQANVIERSGSLVLATLQQRSANTQAQGSLATSSANLRLAEAQVRLGAQQANFANQVSALELAFDGNQQAQNYITNLMSLANGATSIQIGAEQDATQNEIDGINALTTAGQNAGAAGAAARAERERKEG